MFDTYLDYFGVAARPIRVVGVKYFGISRHAEGADIVHRERESRSRRRWSPPSLHCSSFYLRFSEKRLRSSIIALISDSRTFDRS